VHFGLAYQCHLGPLSVPVRKLDSVLVFFSFTQFFGMTLFGCLPDASRAMLATDEGISFPAPCEVTFFFLWTLPPPAGGNFPKNPNPFSSTRVASVPDSDVWRGGLESSFCVKPSPC